jgi:hypothetical protein
MSINEMTKVGITKFRQVNWTNPDDHMEMNIIEGRPGPWFKLWSPVNELIGTKNPQTLLVTMMGDLNDKCWYPYEM